MASRVAVIGEQVRVQGFALAGAIVRVAEDPDAARSAWLGLPDDVAVVILTPAAHEAVADRPPHRLTVVMPV
jgi:vacuolar-type H+-ATPase subunit F/Vma7